MELFVHIGYPKTGTLFLQRNIFLHEESFHYLGKPGRSWVKKDALYDMFFSIHFHSDTRFEQNLLNHQQLMASRLSDRMPNVISDEGFIRKATNLKSRDRGIDIKKTLQRFHRIVTPSCQPKYFFVMRNHLDMLYGYYNQHQKQMQKLGINEQRLQSLFQDKHHDHTFLLNIFNYYALYQYLTDLSGHEAGVFFFEDLTSNNLSFLRQIYRFMSLDLDYIASNRLTKLRESENYDSLLTALKRYYHYYVDKQPCHLTKSFFKKNAGLIQAYYQTDLAQFTCPERQAKLKQHHYIA